MDVALSPWQPLQPWLRNRASPWAARDPGPGLSASQRP
jgi:hypothetical protein